MSEIKAALLHTCNDDTNMFDNMTRWAGYCLTGEILLQKCLFYVGDGSNGKSTLTDIFASIFDKYTDALKSDIFNDDKKANRSLITLRNKRFVYASELSEDCIQAEMFKRLVGDKRIKLNKLFKEDMTLNI